MTKRNAFITAALEELQQESSVGDLPSVAVNTPTATGATPPGEGPVSEINLDQSVDTVAALMQKNTQLATENLELKKKVDGNDAKALASASDSEKKDLEEAVGGMAALEELSHLADMTVQSGQANKASVASLAFALEQIMDRLGVPNIDAALEDVEGKEPREQAKSISSKALSIARTIGRTVEKHRKKK